MTSIFQALLFAITLIEGNTTLTVVFHDGTGERIDKTKDQSIF